MTQCTRLNSDFVQASSTLRSRGPGVKRPLASFDIHCADLARGPAAFPKDEILRVLRFLAAPEAWPFLHLSGKDIEEPASLEALEEQCSGATVVIPAEEVPRPCSKDRIFLHVF